MSETRADDLLEQVDSMMADCFRCASAVREYIKRHRDFINGWDAGDRSVVFRYDDGEWNIVRQLKEGGRITLHFSPNQVGPKETRV
jgi:hypothetical protein